MTLTNKLHHGVLCISTKWREIIEQSGLQNISPLKTTHFVPIKREISLFKYYILQYYFSII